MDQSRQTVPNIYLLESYDRSHHSMARLKLTSTQTAAKQSRLSTDLSWTLEIGYTHCLMASVQLARLGCGLHRDNKKNSKDCRSGIITVWMPFLTHSQQYQSTERKWTSWTHNGAADHSMNCFHFPSVVWYCWLGDRKGIQYVKKSCTSNPRRYFEGLSGDVA